MARTESGAGRRWMGWVVVLVCGCGGPPSIGEDAAAFQAVDALYTAVSLRDPAQLDRCADHLKELNDAGKLPAPAFAKLGAIAAEARSGEWEDARGRLRTMMAGQRR